MYISVNNEYVLSVLLFCTLTDDTETGFSYSFLLDTH